MLNNDHESFAAAQARAAAAVSCESVVLPSGLTVLCRTMPGYSSVHAIYATGFGSVHRAFKLDGKQVTLPAGTAHFLEHKMCETPKGDSFTFYAKTGASANAFTSYDLRYCLPACNSFLPDFPCNSVICNSCCSCVRWTFNA